MEEVSLANQEVEKRIVIDGQISNEYQRHLVQISLSDQAITADYQILSGAEVILQIGEEEYRLREGLPGNYWTDSLAGVPGKPHQLTIYIDDEIYEATDTMPLPSNQIDSVVFLEREGWREYEFRRHQFGFSQPNQWQLIVSPLETPTVPGANNSMELGNPLGIERGPDGSHIFTYFTHPDIAVSGLLDFEATDYYLFRPNKLITQKKYELSPSYYQFLRAAFLETEWRGTLFDSQSANVQGNISNDGLGFFRAVAMAQISYHLD